MEEKIIWIIELTDVTDKLKWKRYIVMDVSGINNILPKSSLCLCEDFIKALDKFNTTNNGGILLKARIVSVFDMDEEVLDRLISKVIMLNPMGLIFDEMMLLHLRYDKEIPMNLIEGFLGKSSATLQNTFGECIMKYNIPHKDKQGIKNIKMQNDYKFDFPGGFFPVFRMVR